MQATAHTAAQDQLRAELGAAHAAELAPLKAHAGELHAALQKRQAELDDAERRRIDGEARMEGVRAELRLALGEISVLKEVGPSSSGGVCTAERARRMAHGGAAGRVGGIKQRVQPSSPKRAGRVRRVRSEAGAERRGDGETHQRLGRVVLHSLRCSEPRRTRAALSLAWHCRACGRIASPTHRRAAAERCRCDRCRQVQKKMDAIRQAHMARVKNVGCQTALSGPVRTFEPSRARVTHARLQPAPASTIPCPAYPWAALA